MNARVAVLRQLISESSYPIDEASVAEAIIVRAMARRAIPDLAFRDPPSKPRVRSFRHHAGVRSFRLARPDRRSLDRRTSAAGRSPSPA